MGYSTDFTGVLTFNKMLNASQIARLNKVLGEDVRNFDDHRAKFWGEANFDGYHIDLEFTLEYDGIKWNGTEKTYGMIGAVNGIVNYMKHLFPDFGLEGTLHAQGERVKDSWKLVMVDGVATRFENDVDVSQYVECPECGHEFKPGEEE
jgi:hypothetical protein